MTLLHPPTETPFILLLKLLQYVKKLKEEIHRKFATVVRFVIKSFACKLYFVYQRRTVAWNVFMACDLIAFNFSLAAFIANDVMAPSPLLL